MDNRRAGQEQIETAIRIMSEARGMKLETPITWHKESDRDVYTLKATISGFSCQWALVGEAVENYVDDLNVRYSVDFNLQSYFIPR